MEQRFEKAFAKCQENNEGLFVPFVTLCDPDYETSLEILKTLVVGGANALELGFPFSDPCADGPVIQKADKRALKSGAKVDDFFRIISDFRQFDEEIPISILVYSNVVVARGIDRFFKDAHEAGIDAVLIADIPTGMLNTCDNFKECAVKNGVDTVLIAPPNASDEVIEKVARLSEGYVYVLSRFGITGTDKESGYPLELVQKLKEHNAPHTLLGFGISKPEHVKKALEIGVDGAIAGSGVVQLIENNLDDKEKMLSDIQDYVAAMKAATVNRL